MGGRGAFHLPALRPFDKLRVAPSEVEGRQAQGALSLAEGRSEDGRLRIAISRVNLGLSGSSVRRNPVCAAFAL